MSNHVFTEPRSKRVISAATRQARSAACRAACLERAVTTLPAIARKSLTIAEIVHRINVPRRTVARHIALLHGSMPKLVYIAAWARMNDLGKPNPCFQAGDLPDKPRPGSLDECELRFKPAAGSDEDEDEDMVPCRIAPAFKPFRHEMDIALFGPYRPAVQGEAHANQA